jgi:probable phosphoglycerate mutase
MTTVVAVRHGETDWNRERRVQGWAASALNDRGRRQARLLGRHVSERFDVDRIVASDLRRTRETVTHLRDGRSLPSPTFDRDWRERCFGVFQGLTYDEVFGEFPEHDASLGVVGLQSTPERGESMLEVRDRVLGAWAALLDTAGEDETVLVVTHGGPIYVLLAAAQERALPDALVDYHQDNCAVNVLEHEDGSAAVRHENDCSYRDADAVADD